MKKTQKHQTNSEKEKGEISLPGFLAIVIGSIFLDDWWDHVQPSE